MILCFLSPYIFTNLEYHFSKYLVNEIKEIALF